MSHADLLPVTNVCCRASGFAIAKAVLLPSMLSLDADADMTYVTARPLCLDAAEAAVSVITACLPAVRHVLTRHTPAQWKFWSKTDPHASQSSKRAPTFGSVGSPRGGRRSLFSTQSVDYKSDGSSDNNTHAMTLSPSSGWSKTHAFVTAIPTEARQGSRDSDSPLRPPSPRPTDAEHRLSEPSATYAEAGPGVEGWAPVSPGSARYTKSVHDPERTAVYARATSMAASITSVDSHEVEVGRACGYLRIAT